MSKLLQLILKRPTDKQIRVFKLVFGLTLSGILTYNLIFAQAGIESVIFGYNVEDKKEYIKYTLCALGIMPIVLWATGISLLKSRNMRISQVIYAILIFFVSGSVLSDKAGLDYTTLISLLGFVPLIAGISGKLITTKGKRHGEKITKVRV